MMKILIIVAFLVISYPAY
ncbi:hypothetical protein HVY24_00100 [Escherichia coli]|nr:hypothetical protein HVY24_00100 [Escherichia coli]